MSCGSDGCSVRLCSADIKVFPVDFRNYPLCGHVYNIIQTVYYNRLGSKHVLSIFPDITACSTRGLRLSSINLRPPVSPLPTATVRALSDAGNIQSVHHATRIILLIYAYDIVFKILPASVTDGLTFAIPSRTVFTSTCCTAGSRMGTS